MKTALLIGATGLVGSQLLSQLLSDDRIGGVVALGRRPLDITHAKLRTHVIDFSAPESWSHLVQGDVAFSALGTTIKIAKTQEAQRRVDYEYQLAFAKAAALKRVPTYVLCSSAGADPAARTFYSRIKGELDRDVQALGFERVRIMRPSLLGGERKDVRTGEKIGSVVLGAVNALGILRKYREISGEVVAKAMLNAAFDPQAGVRIFTLDEVFSAASEQPRPVS